MTGSDIIPSPLSGPKAYRLAGNAGNFLSENERNLVQLILKGDSAAFQAFYSGHQKNLIRACWYFLGDDPEVEDVVQETFLKALRNLEGFRFECSLGTWLNHIAVNLCRDLLEKKKKNLPFSLDFFKTQPSKEQKTAYPEETLKLLREEIQNLGGREGELVTLREIQGLSYEAIAHQLKMPVGSVTSGLFRARQKLVEKVRAKLPDWEGMAP
jgi:RNA polymerase sigma-70 factor (ECF subfamily)